MYFTVRLGPERPDGVVTILMEFGEPAGNDLIVPAAVESMKKLGLTGGRGVLFYGPASLPVAMALAHEVAHWYQFVGCYDPKLGRYVVVVSHTAERRVGELMAEGSSINSTRPSPKVAFWPRWRTAAARSQGRA